MIQIPIRPYPFQRITITLSRRSYDLEFFWNARDGAMHMSIFRDDVILISGLKMVIDWPLTRYYAITEAPPGEFYLVDTDGKGRPALEDFGDRVLLVYVTPDDIKELIGVSV